MANKPVLHRRDHEHGGADVVRIVYETVGGPGGGGIQFDTDNEGGWLEITTNDVSPDTAVGMGLYSHVGVEIKNSTDGPLHLTNSAQPGVQILDLYPSLDGDGIVIGSSQGGVHISGGSGSDAAGVILGGAHVLMPDLNTFDPHIAGCLWSDGGVVTVSAG